MNFAPDNAIENLHEYDLLEGKRYAQTLEKIVLNAKTPFTIGIFGEWGSGKSSIVKTVQNSIRNNPENKDIEFVVYDAWKYTQDSFRRTFLVEIANYLKSKKIIKDEEYTKVTQNLYENKTSDVQVKPKANWFYIILLVLFIGGISFGIAYLFQKYEWSIKYEMTVQVLVGILSTIIALAKNLLIDYKVSVTTPLLFSPEQFEERFDNLVKTFLEKKKGKGKLAIIIDNLDRCSKESAYQLLGDIKGFLEKEGVVFVIPVDEDSFVRNLSSDSGKKGGAKEAKEFLRKIFNTVIRIKKIQEKDLFDLSSEINQIHNLGFSQDTIYIVSKKYATNPRRIVQIFNNIAIEKQVMACKYNEDFANEFESLIAILVIIREEWCEDYYKVVQNPRCLYTFNGLCKEAQDFVKQFRVFCDIPEQEIEKLLYNRDRHEGIDINNLSDCQYETLSLDNEEESEKIVDYLIHELEKHIQRQTFATGVLNTFYHIISLNAYKELPTTKNRVIVGLLNHQRGFLDRISEEYWEKFFGYVETCRGQGLCELREYVEEQFNKTFTQEQAKNKIIPEIWNLGFIDFIKNSEELGTIDQLQEKFLSYAKLNQDFALHQVNMDKDKVLSLVNKSYVDFLCSSIVADFESLAKKELHYIADFYRLELQDILPLFAIRPNLGTISTENDIEDAKFEFLPLVVMLTDYMKKINKTTEGEHAEIAQFLEYLKNTRYYIDTNGYMHLWQIAQDMGATNMLEFYLQIYRITCNVINVVSYISSLVQFSEEAKELLYESLVQMKAKHGFHLRPLKSILFAFSDNNVNLFKIYEGYFCNDDIDNMMCNKLQELVETPVTQNNQEIFENFFGNVQKRSKVAIEIGNILSVMPIPQLEKTSRALRDLAFVVLRNNKKYSELRSHNFILDLVKDSKARADLLNILGSMDKKREIQAYLRIIEGLSQTKCTKKEKDILKKCIKKCGGNKQLVKKIKKIEENLIHGKNQ
ncbi:MAG TPA: KAP family NTPase [Candidatus Helicobacter avistercoris]|nr:KAP family NTPase [Candidatus Helicobacter avistercoris]